MTTAESLDKLIGDHYRTAIMGQGASQSVFAAYCAAVKADADLEPLAQSTLTALKAQKINPARCAITAAKIAFLEQALNQQRN